MLLLLILPAIAACPAEISSVEKDLASAFKAYDAWDWAQFDKLEAQLSAELPCVDARVSTDDAVKIHLLDALRAARKKDEAAATSAFRGLLAVQPDYVPPQNLAAAGSLLRRAYDAAKVEAPEHFAPLSDSGWTVDGTTPATLLPTDRATVVQHQRPDGTLQTWVVPGPPLPADLQAAMDPQRVAEKASAKTAPASTPKNTANKAHLSLPLAIAGVASAGLGGFSLYLGHQTWAAYPQERQDAVAAKVEGWNHVALAGGAALGAVGGGLIVTALVSGTW